MLTAKEPCQAQSRHTRDRCGECVLQVCCEPEFGVNLTLHPAQVHLLPDAGHWVHADNPEGLLKIMSPSLSSARL